MVELQKSDWNYFTTAPLSGKRNVCGTEWHRILDQAESLNLDRKLWRSKVQGRGNADSGLAQNSAQNALENGENGIQ
jgi:hypothetical protein